MIEQPALWRADELVVVLPDRSQLRGRRRLREELKRGPGARGVAVQVDGDGAHHVAGGTTGADFPGRPPLMATGDDVGAAAPRRSGHIPAGVAGETPSVLPGVAATTHYIVRTMAYKVCIA